MQTKENECYQGTRLVTLNPLILKTVCPEKKKVFFTGGKCNNSFILVVKDSLMG